LELRNAGSHCLCNEGFDIFPIIDCFVGFRGEPGAADEENGAIGCGFVLYMQAAFGFCVDRPRRSDGKPRRHEAFG
jgi:hypothetical protein